MKKYLIISSKSPLDGWHAEEILELILTFASLEHDISVVFSGDAILQLGSVQNYQNKVSQTFITAINAFKLFDLDNIYILKPDINLNLNQALYNLDYLLNKFPKVKLIEFADLEKLKSAHDIVFDF